MGNVNMEARQIHYRGGEKPMSVEEAIKEAGSGYVLPIASAETLGGIKVGDNLTINSETGALSGPAQYVLPAASGETLGGVKVGSGLSIADGVLSVSGGGGGYNNHIFSNTEQKVGTWLDGRDLFERTFVAYDNGDWQLPLNGNNILTGLTGCDMILVDRFYLKRVDGDNQYWYSVTGDTIVTLVPNAYGGSVYFNINWSAGIAYLAFTLRYTKTPTP